MMDWLTAQGCRVRREDAGWRVVGPWRTEAAIADHATPAAVAKQITKALED